MPKIALKYLVSGVIIIIFIIVITVITIKSRSTSQSSLTPSVTPTSPAVAPNYQLPTPIPLLDFTGAVATQELPTDLKSIGEEKTALRRLTPLFLDFAVIEFDYENDKFLVQILDPIEENKTQFTSWRTQTYPALLDAQFSIN
jgi:hypothetical protein